MNVPSWIMEYYPYWKWEADEMRVRFSIFTIICACGGLPALVWSVSDLIHHRKNGHHISAFIIFLLLTDFAELFLSPYILIKYLLNETPCSYTDWTCRVLCSLWSLSRGYGLLLNQLVALEGILSVIFPLYTAAVFTSLYFIIFYILVFLCIVIVEILFMQEYFFIDLSIFIVSVITWIISCGASRSADRHSSRKPDHHILVIFMFNLLVIYLPLHFLSFFSYFYTPYLQNLLPVWHIPVFLVSVRLISDPLLCVLVCRQNLSIQTSQTGLRSDRMGCL